MQSQRRRIAGLTLAVCTCFWIQGAGFTAEKDSTWSFADHPHPHYEDMTTEEREWVDLKAERLSKFEGCTARVKAEYDVYLRRYPKYKKSGDADSNFRRWKTHLIRDLNDASAMCLSFTALDKLLEIRSIPTTFYFCGRYSRPPRNPHEHRLVQWIDELFMYAQVSVEIVDDIAIRNLLVANERRPEIDLNADIIYYLYNLFEPMPDGPLPGDTSHLDPLLSDKQKAFLKRAADERNIEAVLETTPPCKPREVEPDRPLAPQEERL